jgi:glycosyltransferase involved in cell wall biosynthesis
MPVVKKEGRLVAGSSIGCTFGTVMRSGGYDAAHINNTFTYQPASVIAAARAGIPTISHLRNPVKFTAIKRALAGPIKGFVAVNKVLAHQFDEAGYRVHHIHDAVESTSINAVAASKLREELLESGRYLIGSLGRLDHQKGYECFIDAARLISDRIAGARFVVAGEGPERAALQARIDNSGLHDQFRLIGFHSEPRTLTAALHLFVCSSLWEGLPLSILDAMMIGVPIVSTSVGGIAEVISDRKSGWLVAPGDVKGLARAINEALSLSADSRRELTLAAESNVRPFRI